MIDKEYVLVTGGCGYIGSHVTVELLNNNYNVVVIDNLINSSSKSLDRIKEITGKEAKFIELDLLFEVDIMSVFSDYNISSVIHLAGLKSVGESVKCPTKYYENNFVGTVNLIKVMEIYGVHNLVFSSSATVYGDPIETPITEDHSIGNTTNPYGTSKYMIERFLMDLCVDDKWAITSLRYFNPIGAHDSGLIGEDPKGIPNNLLPYVMKVANGELENLTIFGNDYDTKDGTGIRDYIHVVDLANGHLKAIEKMEKGYSVINLGTGVGASVLDIVQITEDITGRKVPFVISGRRDGDIATSIASHNKAMEELEWSTRYTIREMIESSWKWKIVNPNGYE